MVELNLEWLREYEDYLADVGFPEIAAEMAGVYAETFNEWLEKAEEEDCPAIYLELKKATRFGKSRFKGEHIRCVHYAGMNGDTKANMEILKAIDPDRFNVTPNSNQNNAPQDINITITAKKPVHQIERTAEEKEIIDV